MAKEKISVTVESAVLAAADSDGLPCATTQHEPSRHSTSTPTPTRCTKPTGVQLFPSRGRHLTCDHLSTHPGFVA